MSVLFLLPDGVTVDYGTLPSGTVEFVPEGRRPFAGRTFTAAALALLLRLHAEWYPTRWDVTPKGRRADLRGADLTDADLTDADLRGADLTGADLTGAVLTDAVLRGADLRDADLTDADLTGADLTGAVLTDADLRGANLRGANLTDAVLRGAVLSAADLRDADLTGADLTEADLRGAPSVLAAIGSEFVASMADDTAPTPVTDAVLGEAPEPPARVCITDDDVPF